MFKDENNIKRYILRSLTHHFVKYGKLLIYQFGLFFPVYFNSKMGKYKYIFLFLPFFFLHKKLTYYYIALHLASLI